MLGERVTVVHYSSFLGFVPGHFFIYVVTHFNLLPLATLLIVNCEISSYTPGRFHGLVFDELLLLLFPFSQLEFQVLNHLFKHL